jgi:hypothetical protein
LLASALTDWIAALAAVTTTLFASAAVWQLVHIKDGARSLTRERYLAPEIPIPRRTTSK